MFCYDCIEPAKLDDWLKSDCYRWTDWFLTGWTSCGLDIGAVSLLSAVTLYAEVCWEKVEELENDQCVK